MNSRYNGPGVIKGMKKYGNSYKEYTADMEESRAYSTYQSTTTHNYEDDDVTESRRKRERDYADYGTKEEADRDHNIEARLEKSDVPEDVLMNPGDVDEDKWKKAKEAAEKEYGPGKWAAVSAIYKKMGGKFHKKS